MKTLEQFALIFMFAGVGAQAGYPIFGLVQFFMIVMVILGISWMRHKQVMVTMTEIVIVVVSALTSVCISTNVASMEEGVSLRLISLCVITLAAWLAVPKGIKNSWYLFK